MKSITQMSATMKPMDRRLTRRLNQRGWGVVLMILFLVLCAGAYGLNIKTQQTPEKVFWDALGNNLVLDGVTCTSDEDVNKQHRETAVSLDLASKANTHGFITLTANGSRVVTETLTTKTDEYVRYTAISSGNLGDAKAKEYAKAVNVWARQANGASGGQSVFEQLSLGGCVVPFAHLTTGPRDTLVNELKEAKVFETDLSKSSWHFRVGEPYREYEVTVQPVPYITFVKNVAKAYGLTSLDTTSVESYSGRTPEKVVIRIGASSHRIEQIVDKTTKITFTITDFDKIPEIKPPAKTIPTAELQKRLEAVQ